MGDKRDLTVLLDHLKASHHPLPRLLISRRLWMVLSTKNITNIDGSTALARVPFQGESQVRGTFRGFLS